LSDLRDTVSEPKIMPILRYKPQKPGAVQSFAYFFDESQLQRVGLRGPPKVIELFCGAGGMHLGYKANRFITVKAIDNDEMIIKTFRENNKEVASAAECVCVKKYLKEYKQVDTVEYCMPRLRAKGFLRLTATVGKTTGSTTSSLCALPMAYAGPRLSLGFLKT
jgi:C-5 cytosine-specific DNA methylase